jgi:hypothetical protein
VTVEASPNDSRMRTIEKRAFRSEAMGPYVFARGMEQEAGSLLEALTDLLLFSFGYLDSLSIAFA